jgi:hypothetical protein
VHLGVGGCSTWWATLAPVTGWRGFVRFSITVFAVGQVVSGLLIFWAVGLLVSSLAADRAVRRRRAAAEASRRHPSARALVTGPTPATVGRRRLTVAPA